MALPPLAGAPVTGSDGCQLQMFASFEELSSDPAFTFNSGFSSWRHLSALRAGGALLHCCKGSLGLDQNLRTAGPCPMWTVLFYSGDGDEPPHVHVERDEHVAKFWLDPLRLARSGGYGRAENRNLARLAGERHLELLEAWNDYFGD